jgi:hypothetical protein
MSNNERIEEAEKKLKQKIEAAQKKIERKTKSMSETEKIDFLFSEAKKIDEKEPIILDK